MFCNRGREGGRDHFTAFNSLADAREYTFLTLINRYEGPFISLNCGLRSTSLIRLIILSNAGELSLWNIPQLLFSRGGGGGYIIGWLGAGATLNPLPNTRPCSADFATLYQISRWKSLPYSRLASLSTVSLFTIHYSLSYIHTSSLFSLELERSYKTS